MPGLQTLYLTNTESVITPVTSIKQMNLAYGTASDSSTKVVNTASGTYQFIPANAANGTAATVSTSPTSKGWIFENTIPGRYWPGTWTIQAYVACSNSGVWTGETGNLEAKFYIVTPGTTTVTEYAGNASGTFTSTAQNLSANNFTFSSNLTVNQFFYIYPTALLYVELYWVLANNAFTTTTALWLDSPNTFIKTSFFEEYTNFNYQTRRRTGMGN